MRLSFDQIKSVTVGALSVKREDDGIHFYKCTEKQIDAWYRQREGLGNGARTTTGVRLDFITNSEKIQDTLPVAKNIVEKSFTM